MIKKKWKLLMLVIFFLFMIIDFSACINTIVTPGTEENAPEETHTCTNGLCLDYYLTLEGDTSNRPHMVLKISNIQEKEYLNLVISWPLLDDNSNPDPSLFTMIYNISVTDSEGNKFPIEFSQKSFIGSNCSFSYLGLYIYYDILTIYTNGNSEITIEYDLASNVEIWTGLGGSINNPRDSEYFWAVYLENILYRPEGHQFIEAAYLNIDLPSGWNFTTVYPLYGNTVELGTMDYMYGDNVRWMNYQRGGLILFKEGPFILESENIYGVEVMDVYTKDYAGDRCHEANYQYFEYFCDHIGILPVNGVLTFCPSIDANKIPLASIFQSAPYGSPHSLMGEYIGAGGDLAIASGGELTQVPLWDLYSFSDEKTYGLYMHGVVRYWIDRFIQLETVDEEWFKCGFGNYYENMAVSSKYGYGQIKERRFKPMYEFYKENIDHLETCIESGGHDFLRYCKPALVAYYINELLKEQSNSEKCLDDAIQILFENASMGETVTRYSFIYALNSLTDYDFTNIVNDYIYGNNKVLDLDKYFY